MADPTLTELLAQGPDAWNQHRRATEPRPLDLNGVDLRGRNLAGIDLSGAFLSSANLTEANLTRANLDRVYAVAVDLTGADLSEASFHAATLATAACVGTRFRMVRGSKSSLTNANLDNADFSEANLRRVNLTGASVRDTSFARARLVNASFWDSDFTRTSFTEAVFDRTVIGSSDLAQARDLHTIVHEGPSAVDMQTLMRATGLPSAFLRGIGLPDAFITYLSSLQTSLSPVQFYSCFISYSAADEDFCRRLYADLQSAGIRCWFAPFDLKIGERYTEQITESIISHDKLLAVFSARSTDSQWMRHEVELALEQERARNETVLFPIRLDDAVMQAPQDWAVSLRRSRHIGDFSEWRDHDAYQRAFTRLVRALIATSTLEHSERR